jgi:hypothetical protein
VWLLNLPAIWNSKVTDALRLEHSEQFSQVEQLRIGLADMLENVVGDDDVERAVLERQARTIDYRKVVTVLNLPAVVDIDGIYLTTKISMVTEVVCYEARTRSNLQHSKRHYGRFQPENAFDLERLRVTAHGIESGMPQTLAVSPFLVHWQACRQSFDP